MQGYWEFYLALILTSVSRNSSWQSWLMTEHSGRTLRHGGLHAFQAVA